jgi:hypothetical protein
MTMDAAELRRLDREHCWHPLFQHSLLDGGTELTVFERADGCFLYDSDGRAFLDAAARRSPAPLTSSCSDCPTTHTRRSTNRRRGWRRSSPSCCPPTRCTAT